MSAGVSMVYRIFEKKLKKFVSYLFLLLYLPLQNKKNDSSNVQYVFYDVGKPCSGDLCVKLKL